ncbi:MAG TPA: protein kinase [Pyrinomonadaceae bacterium]|nr:protein kinase [Pyrinomonadaceae bacterium]
MKKCPKCGIEYPDAITLCPSDGIALEKTDDPVLGKTLIGKYRVDEKLSEGGMGAVYKGTHVLMDKTVAIKVLRPSLAADEKIVARFSREARAASRISHPNALAVTDFGEAEDGVVFLVMEFLAGKTLKDVVRDEGPMSVERAVDIMKQVGDALKAAHDQGVVHRDLKSDNIMLISTPGEHAKVLDFGIAKINEPEGEPNSELTAPNLVIGTPQYMSPEQCSQSSQIDSRSDIYSFGVILYEMLVGHVPFTGESPTIVMLKHMQEPVPSVLDERPDIPPSIGQIISRAMAKLPENRYQSITDLLEDLAIATGAPLRTASGSHEPVPAPRVNVQDDLDEITVVRPREVAAPPPPYRAPVTVPIAPATAPASSFKPGRILIPAVVAVLVLFGMFYLFSRNSATSVNANSNTNQPGLVADPNSQPVQAASPPSGRDEASIPSGGNLNATNQNTNQNVNASPTVTPIETPTPAANTNSNSNSNREAPLPPPTRTVSPVDVPLPSPPPAGSPTPKSSPPPAKPSPTDGPN